METEVNNNKIKEGVRFVVGYKSRGDGFFYLSNLCTSQGEAEKKASSLVKDVPSLVSRLNLLKVIPKKDANRTGQVLLWAHNPDYLALEGIYSQPGKARNFISGTSLEGYFSISTFNEEVVKSYKLGKVRYALDSIRRFFGLQ